MGDHSQLAPLQPVVRKEPKGVVLVIYPFNPPIWTCIDPLVGTISAGNAIAVKPSKMGPHVSTLFADLIPKYLVPKLIAVVNGAAPEATKLLELRWDHSEQYTGGRRVGRIVSIATVKHLTPVSLHLGSWVWGHPYGVRWWKLRWIF
ncbi:ALDH-like protein [Macrolepiota fuliginosa MF-IS2]|uniref:ALDH-like protein n=1 Tax=Macrolepiota fuliginosa MF-IS2 TaxID=1400762 RepID=A0A9P5X545_9AGAR|nr:ALDH-like protein [Macrolepiota fuliginosa MF-IS2]